jgi:CRP-like cAMP-binding protein
VRQETVAADHAAQSVGVANNVATSRAPLSISRIGASLSEARSHFVDRLPLRDRERLLGSCELTHLKLGAVLSTRGETATHAYFPTEAFISLVAELEDHPSLEVGMIGREGMLGIGLALGMSHAPLRALVQGPGACWRIGAAAFRRELALSAPLRRQLDLYEYVLMAQMAASAACLRFHLIGPRLARWLLMSQDRAQSDHFHMTQEILACMLGVRRVGITVAASALQRQGLISYHRGQITVTNRSGLESVACSCYAAAQLVYEDALG